jgi:hypothetical protein
MQKLGSPDRSVLAFETIEGGEEKLRLTVFNVPYIASGFGVAQVSENSDAVMAIEDLVLPGLGRVRPDDEMRIATRALDVRP